MRAQLPGLATTAIGSLPHTQLEIALQQAFLLDIPYLPQLPLRDPAEYMLPQALDGMPGLRFDKDGNAAVDLAEWRKGWLDARLERAVEKGEGLADFEPRPAACAAWRPFAWEVEQRKAPFAKVQIAGPTTLRWALRTTDGSALWDLADGAEIEAQILKLVLAKALAMARRLREAGATPVVFLDEPGLVTFERTSGRHLVALQELRVVILALQREGAHVGVHCCGNTDWASVLALPWDLISLDARLSLQRLADAGDAFARFAQGGGRLALGIVPTNLAGNAREEDPAVAEAASQLLLQAVPAILEKAAPGLLQRCLLTPACGLGLRSVRDAEAVLERLRRAQRALLPG
jgi:methionine synthase II (cobalamin-independent)